MFDSKKLRDYLEANKMSQAELGRKIGVTAAMVNFLASGLKQPSVETLERMADLFSCSTDELLGRGDNNAKTAENQS